MNPGIARGRMLLKPAVGFCLVAFLVATGLLLLWPASATPTCTVTWIGGVDGNFGTAGNWSTGTVPGSGDDVCINATTTTSPAAVADTYTVVLNGNFSVHSLTLGGPTGTQTLVVSSGRQFNVGADSVVNASGILTLGDASGGDSVLNGPGFTLTNSGHLNTITGGGGTRYLRLNITNTAAGAVDIAGSTGQDTGTTTANNGAFTIEDNTTLALSGGSSFTQAACGTFATTIDANTTTFGQLTGGGGPVSLDGKLKVTTLGSPAVGSSWSIISGINRSGRPCPWRFWNGLASRRMRWTSPCRTLTRRRSHRHGWSPSRSPCTRPCAWEFASPSAFGNSIRTRRFASMASTRP